MFSTFPLRVFLFRYRLHYLLAFPLIVQLRAHSRAPSMRSVPVAQKLFRDKRLMVINSATETAQVVLRFVNMDFLHDFSGPHFLKTDQFLLTPRG